jgi:hypothetical protein
MKICWGIQFPPYAHASPPPPIPPTPFRTPDSAQRPSPACRAAQILAEAPGFAAKGITVVAVCPGWYSAELGTPSTLRAPPPPPVLQGENRDQTLQPD